MASSFKDDGYLWLEDAINLMNCHTNSGFNGTLTHYSEITMVFLTFRRLVCNINSTTETFTVPDSTEQGDSGFVETPMSEGGSLTPASGSRWGRTCISFVVHFFIYGIQSFNLDIHNYNYTYLYHACMGEATRGSFLSQPGPSNAALGFWWLRCPCPGQTHFRFLACMHKYKHNYLPPECISFKIRGRHFALVMRTGGLWSKQMFIRMQEEGLGWAGIQKLIKGVASCAAHWLSLCWYKMAGTSVNACLMVTW